MDLTPRIQRRIEAMFAESERRTVSELLMRDCAENLYSGQGNERIQAAVLKLADGSLEWLRYHVYRAQVDWRDVLMAARFGNDVNAHNTWLDQEYTPPTPGTPRRPPPPAFP